MKASREAPKAIRSATRFVSPETPQHQPVEVDLDHAELADAPVGERQIDSPVAETQFERTHSQGESEDGIGAPSERLTKKTSKVTLGRHIHQATDGEDLRNERHKHLKSVRAQREKENFGN